jgi:2-isopropylmalate synthase
MKALIRVLIEIEDEKGNRWTTLGVSDNVIDASYNAIEDGVYYGLMKP